MRKIRFRYNKIINPYSIIVTIILLVIASTSIGYSLLSENLQIFGSATVKKQENIKITAISDPIITDFGVVKNNPVYESTSLTIDDIELPQLTSQVSYQVTMKNVGTIDQQFKAVENEIYSNEDIIYTLDGLKVTDQIASGSEITFTITFHYGELTALPAKTNVGAIINFVFSEVEVVAPSYQKDGLKLSLQGNDEPVNDEWVDQSGNGNVTLNDVTKRSDLGGYYFNGSSSCGLTNRTVLPTTGDFTAEIYLTTGATVSDDLSVLAQKELSNSRESGRIKPFNIYTNNLRLFTNASLNDGTITPTYVSNIQPYTKYHVQVVRQGGELLLYANGQRISTTLFASGNVLSSGTTQIGCYQAVNNQNFDGIIHALRIYDRALTDEELATNYAIDYEKYGEKVVSNLKDYAVANMLTTTGDGLYYLAAENRYIFRGKNVNNYIKLDNVLWRIISFEADGSMKIMRVENNESEIPFDASGNRNLQSTYCTMSETLVDGQMHGCNYFATSNNFTNGIATGTIVNDSSLLNYLNTTVYNSFSADFKQRLLAHNYPIGAVNGTSNLAAVINEERAAYWNGIVGTVTVSDVYYGWSTNVAQLETSDSNNYMLASSESTSIYWTLNGTGENTFDVWTMVRGKSVSKRRASRSNQDIGNGLNYMKVFPTVYISSDIEIDGVGSSAIPFTEIQL